jgi:hypothetical protein
MTRSKKVYKKGDADFIKRVNEVAKRFKGKGGGPESETAINAFKQDMGDGYVSFYSDNSDITNLLTRSKGYVLEITDFGENVLIKLDRKGFRSCFHAFKISK